MTKQNALKDQHCLVDSEIGCLNWLQGLGLTQGYEQCPYEGKRAIFSSNVKACCLVKKIVNDQFIKGTQLKPEQIREIRLRLATIEESISSICHVRRVETHNSWTDLESG